MQERKKPADDAMRMTAAWFNAPVAAGGAGYGEPDTKERVEFISRARLGVDAKGSFGVKALPVIEVGEGEAFSLQGPLRWHPDCENRHKEKAKSKEAE